MSALPLVPWHEPMVTTSQPSPGQGSSVTSVTSTSMGMSMRTWEDGAIANWIKRGAGACPPATALPPGGGDGSGGGPWAHHPHSVTKWACDVCTGESPADAPQCVICDCRKGTTSAQYRASVALVSTCVICLTNPSTHAFSPCRECHLNPVASQRCYSVAN